MGQFFCPTHNIQKSKLPNFFFLSSVALFLEPSSSFFPFFSFNCKCCASITKQHSRQNNKFCCCSACPVLKVHETQPYIVWTCCLAKALNAFDYSIEECGMAQLKVDRMLFLSLLFLCFISKCYLFAREES